MQRASCCLTQQMVRLKGKNKTNRGKQNTHLIMFALKNRSLTGWRDMNDLRYSLQLVGWSDCRWESAITAAVFSLWALTLLCIPFNNLNQFSKYTRRGCYGRLHQCIYANSKCQQHSISLQVIDGQVRRTPQPAAEKWRELAHCC